MSRINLLLERLYTNGLAHDAGDHERWDRCLNITPETGQFLDILVRETKPTRILELGTSNGYSTIWLARAAKSVGATIDTVDMLPSKTEAARKNLAEAGLLEVVTLHTATVNEFLASFADQSVDFIFLDSDRSQYVTWWPDLLRVLNFGTLIVDNASSHPEEVAELRELIRQRGDLDAVVLPIGKGELVVRAR
ncbi:MAG: class I SAM-dependent methyltransferase [Planctomycetaceae bacterium]